MGLLGVVSDTHGLVRPELVAALEGCDAIVHAGDVGRPGVIETLEALAPLTVVRGNNDGWSRDLPAEATLDFEGRRFLVLHDLADLRVDPASEGFDAVVCGHSHRPKIERRGGVLYLNPGSAGPRRFRLPVAVVRVAVGPGSLEPELVELLGPPGSPRPDARGG